MSDHTPTPWEFQNFEIVHEIQKGLVQSVPVYTNRIDGTLNPCSDDWDIAQANAAFIVRAVNAYERDQEIKKELVEALKNALRMHDDEISHGGQSFLDDDEIRAAIAKAEKLI